MDRGRFLILEEQGPLQGVTVYEFPTKDAARSWYDSVAHRELRQHRKNGAKYLIVLTDCLGRRGRRGLSAALPHR